MKKLLLISIVIISFVSCNKTNSNTPPPVPEQDTLLTSFNLYLPLVHAKLVEVFTYDKSTQLASVHGYNYDSSSGTPVLDSAILSFTQSDPTTAPSAYDVTYFKLGNPSTGNAEHHLLFYNNQKQVILDSITSSTAQTSLSVQHFTYDAYGNTTVQWLFGDPQTPGSYILNQIDTLSIPQDNIMSDINYASVGGSVNYFYTWQYSTNLNPLYNVNLAHSLGSLLLFNGYRDFRSINLPSQYSENDSEYFTLNYTWTLNAAGKVVQGSGVDSNSGLLTESYSFTY